MLEYLLSIFYYVLFEVFFHTMLWLDSKSREKGHPSPSECLAFIEILQYYHQKHFFR
jgi:hypothetical protein